MRSKLIAALLRILNSRWMNQTPCRYEFVGNLDAFSRAHIESSLRQSPAITLREFLDVADQFKSCPLKKDGLMVIEQDGEVREGTVWDIRDMENALSKSQRAGKGEANGNDRMA